MNVTAVQNTIKTQTGLLKPTNSVVQKLIENGYKQDNSGIMKKVLEKQEKQILNQKYGFYAHYFKKMLSMPLSPKTINEFNNFVKSGGEIGKKLLEKGFTTLLSTFFILRKSNCIEDFEAKSYQNPETFKLIENIANNDLNKKTFKSLSVYKGKVYTGTGQYIQEALRIGKTHSKRIQNHINNISSYIDKQTIPDSIKLYRGESLHANLMHVKTDSGEEINLGHKMFLASKSNDNKEINKIKEFILDNEITFKIPAFASTSINKNVAIDFTKSCSFDNRVIFNLDVSPNTKGVFIESLYTKGKFKHQNEVLLQKGSEVKIKSLDYDKENGIWILNGKVYNK